MSAKTERLRFLRASKESLNRDIESLEKRGGSDSLPDYKEQLKKLEAEIARVEAQPEMNQDASLASTVIRQRLAGLKSTVDAYKKRAETAQLLLKNSVNLSAKERSDLESKLEQANAGLADAKAAMKRAKAGNAR